MSKFVVGQMVGHCEEYVGIVLDMDFVTTSGKRFVCVKHWDNGIGLWAFEELEPYEEGTDVWPDFIRDIDDEQFEAQCRICGEWFEWEEEWGLTEEAYEGAYCGGSYRCCP